MTAVIRTTRTSQPSGPLRLDSTHPLYDYIAGVVVPSWGIELLSGVKRSSTGNIFNSLTSNGPSRACTSGTTARDQFPGAWSRLGTTTGYSLLSLYQLTSTAGASVRVAGNFTSANYGYEHAPSSSNFRFIVARSGVNTVLTGSAVSTNLKCDIGVVNSTTASLYENGILTAGPTSHGGVATPTGEFSIGADNAGSNTALHQNILNILFKTPLPQYWIKSLAENPWQVFEPEIVIIKPAITTITGTLAITNKNDTVNIAGTPIVSSNISLILKDDLSAISGTSLVTIISDILSFNDKTSIVSSSDITGNILTTNKDDANTTSGTSLITVISDVLNITDKTSISSSSDIIGSISLANKEDTHLNNSTSSISGAIALTNFNDTTIITSIVDNIGSLFTRNNDDISLSTSIVDITSSILFVNNNDLHDIIGVVGTTLYGTINISNASDINLSTSIPLISSNINIFNYEDATSIVSDINVSGTIAIKHNDDTYVLIGSPEIVGTISFKNASDKSTSIPLYGFTHPLGILSITRLGNDYTVSKTSDSYTVTKNGNTYEINIIN